MRVSKRDRVWGGAVAALMLAVLVVVQPHDHVSKVTLSGPGAAFALSEGESVPFRTLGRGVVGPWRCPEALLISSQEVWVKTMAAIAPSCLYVTPPPPEVNWPGSMLVLVTLGEKSTGGYEVEVVGVRRSGSKLLVDAMARKPDSGPQHLNFTTPYHLVEIDRREVESLDLTWVGSDTTIDPASTEETTWGRIKAGEK